MSFISKLYVKKSQLPGAGKGLFTRVDIPEGSLICEYAGVMAKWQDVKDKNTDYVLDVGQGKVIDALRTPQHKGRYANDARGTIRVPGLTNNAYYDCYGCCMAYIRATRRILAGEEILVNYGGTYWKDRLNGNHK